MAENSSGAAGRREEMRMNEITGFGMLNGEPVRAVTITGGKLRVTILCYGAAIQRIVVPDAHGVQTDVCLGHDTLEGYVHGEGYFGATVGRCANRIGGAAFTLNGVRYALTANEGRNQLHGGLRGLDKKIWEITHCTADSVQLAARLADGEEGYPGNMELAVRFSIDGGNGLRIDYTARSDRDTVCNLTNHSYFNLNGAGSGDVLDHTLQIAASAFTPTDGASIPTGELRNVAGTCMDFRAPKRIGRDIGDALIAYSGGYDQNFCLDGSGLRRVAEVRGDRSGIAMAVETTMEGMQLYTANFLSSGVYKDGRQYGPYGALCLETQRYPDAVNHESFPSPVLRAGETYRETTIYRFF